MKKKPVIIISTLLVSIMGIGLGVYLVGQRQSLTGEAAPATSLSITPSTSTKAPGASFSLSVVANTGENQVTGIDLIINYNTANIQVDTITKGSGISVFDQEIRKTIDATGGQISYSAFTLNSSSAVTGSGITVLTINGKVKDGATAGTYNFAFGSGTAVAGVAEGQNLLTGSTPGTITVSGSGATAVPTPTSTSLSTSPTPTGTTTGTGTKTATPTAASSAKTSTPTTMPLPVTGTSWPTVGGIVLGGAVIVLSVILAL
jgi:hypothetical protein